MIADMVKSFGGDYINGLYICDPALMIKAVNNIKGMGETYGKVSTTHLEGEAFKLTIDFFKPLMAVLEGNIEKISKYLVNQTADLQAVVQKQSDNTKIGLIMVLVCVYLGSVVTTVKYIGLDEATVKTVKKTACASHEKYSYNVTFNNVEWNYSP